MQAEGRKDLFDPGASGEAQRCNLYLWGRAKIFGLVAGVAWGFQVCVLAGLPKIFIRPWGFGGSPALQSGPGYTRSNVVLGTPQRAFPTGDCGAFGARLGDFAWAQALRQPLLSNPAIPSRRSPQLAGSGTACRAAAPADTGCP